MLRVRCQRTRSIDGEAGDDAGARERACRGNNRPSRSAEAEEVQPRLARDG